VGQRVAESAQAGATGATGTAPGIPAQGGVAAQAQAVREEVRAAHREARQEAGKAAMQTAKGVGRGVAGFMKPFQRVGGILWLEVMGVFFLVFVLAFTPTVWKTRASFAHGPDQRTFWSAAAIMAVFLYLSISSFWRARKR
jgi:hypothetical protein